jgi:hypothetical protein
MVRCRNGQSVQSKLVTVAAGAASGQLIEYEKGASGVSVQTAYGIEVEVSPAWFMRPELGSGQSLYKVLFQGGLRLLEAWCKTITAVCIEHVHGRHFEPQALLET